ncbi:MAG: hypothetical protein IJT30_11520 [Muribaculaceae bacterium]|nr:hypothetical protein [Muribaculaceae bacterium]
MSAYLKNSRLQVACNTGEGIEMCFCFQPCMQNKLMTFSHVGVRAVDRATCDPLSLFRDSNMEWLNISTSDNIGPVGVKGYSNFVGGNHLWHRPSASGVPGKGEATEVFTAQCDSFRILADGMPLAQTTATDCRRVTVEVWNTLFDPLVEPAEGAAMLSSPLIREHATYALEDNTITVTIEHHYLRSFVVSRYYGMQSMFVGESSILTPNGPYRRWTSQGSIKSFKKEDHRWLNHFVERSSSGWCQTAWLRQDDLGSHECLHEDSPIFARGSNKCYHVLMDNWPVEAGESHYWRGVYVWSRPLIDDDFVTVNKGSVNGYTLLAIDTKQAGSVTIDRPEWWAAFYTPAQSPDIEVTATDATVTITAAKASGMVMLEYDENSGVTDVNANVPLHGDEWYTLQGQRIDRPTQAGIYVHNGTKVLVAH